MDKKNSLLDRIKLGVAGLTLTGLIAGSNVSCVNNGYEPYVQPKARGDFTRDSCAFYTCPPGSPNVEQYDFTPSVLKNYTADGKGVLHTEVGVVARLYGLTGRKVKAEIVMVANEGGEPVDRNESVRNRGLMSMETTTIPVRQDGERVSFKWNALFLGKYQVIWSAENGMEIGRSEFIVRQ